MKQLVLTPLPHEAADDRVKRQCKIERLDDDHLTDTQTLWFDYDGAVPPLDDLDCDAYVLAVVMAAMLEGRDLVVRGSVSLELLSNLEEFRQAWNKWRPESYQTITVTVDTCRDNQPGVPGAVCAFSGGLDAVFSVWRHRQRRAGYRSQKINRGAMIHGFDIPLSEEAPFERACQRGRRTLRSIDLDLVAMRTNLRDLSQVYWGDLFSCALAAALSNLKSIAGTCIIGSSNPYDALTIPWGSTPITDHLLGSDQFRVIHDGATHNRMEKAVEAADWQQGLDDLRVCWEGDIKDENCGVCEKCVRTQLNFLAAGFPIPKSFPSRVLDEAALGAVVISGDAIFSEWQLILDHARQRKIDAPWVDQVTEVIRKSRQLKADRHRPSRKDLLLPPGSKRRKLAKFAKDLIKP